MVASSRWSGRLTRENVDRFSSRFKQNMNNMKREIYFLQWKLPAVGKERSIWCASGGTRLSRNPMPSGSIRFTSCSSLQDGTCHPRYLQNKDNNSRPAVNGWSIWMRVHVETMGAAGSGLSDLITATCDHLVNISGRSLTDCSGKKCLVLVPIWLTGDLVSQSDPCVTCGVFNYHAN